MFTLCFMHPHYVFIIITYILLVADWASTGMVTNPARVVKLTEKLFFPLSPTSGFISLLSLLLLSATTASFGIANCHRVSPETKSGHAIMYIRCLLPRVRRHRDCYSSNQGSSSGGCCLFSKSDEPNFVCPSFPTTAITLDYIIK